MTVGKFQSERILLKKTDFSYLPLHNISYALLSSDLDGQRLRLFFEQISLRTSLCACFYRKIALCTPFPQNFAL